MAHPLRWHTGSPLWSLSLADGGTSPVRFNRPVILRFAGDDFVDRLQRVLGQEPARVSEFAVRHETWRTPPEKQAGWLPLADEMKEPPPKLYQPAHNRFYLIAGQFVCQTRGLPDRTIDVAAQERAFFVVRKLVSKAGFALNPDIASTFDEYGWFGDRQRGQWLRVAQPETDAPLGEERLAMFPFSFEEGDRRRRLMAGMIPVASREIYEGGNPAQPVAVISSEAAADPRLARFSAEIGAELKGLSSMPSGVKAADAQDRLVSLLIVFGDYLSDVLPAVMDEINGGPKAPGKWAAGVVKILQETEVRNVSWADLLANAVDRDRRAEFSAGERSASLTPIQQNFTTSAVRTGAARLESSQLRKAIAEALSDPRTDEVSHLLADRIAPLASQSFVSDAAARDQMLAELAELAGFLAREAPGIWAALTSHKPPEMGRVEHDVVAILDGGHLGASTFRAALVDADTYSAAIAEGDTRVTRVVRSGATPSHVKAAAAQLTDGRLTAALSAYFEANPIVAADPPTSPLPDSVFVIRCLFDRPACAPLLGPVVGRPSRPFRLAAYFDPDAPVRPLRIRMPLDTSPEGLRKFPKGVSVVLSDELRKQMARAEQAGMQGLIDGPGPGPTFDLGVICSLSIPIISICALILLMVIVNLLNIIFSWIPFFRICLPAPVKAK